MCVCVAGGGKRCVAAVAIDLTKVLCALPKRVSCASDETSRRAQHWIELMRLSTNTGCARSVSRHLLHRASREETSARALHMRHRVGTLLSHSEDAQRRCTRHQHDFARACKLKH